MNHKKYSNIALDHTKVVESLTDLGVGSVSEYPQNGGKHLNYKGLYKGREFLVKVFINKGGKCTLGHATGYSYDDFTEIADHIVNFCKFSDKTRLEVSVPKFGSDSLEHLLVFLRGEGASVTSEDHASFTQFRVSGPRQDSLTIKLYQNGTMQLQGVHAHLAAMVEDFLTTVMSLDSLFEHQKSVYKIPVTLMQVKDDLLAKVPDAHDYLEDVVRRQFTTALALTKVGIELEDYSAIAFPALRGLEGFSFQLMRSELGLRPAQKDELGSYFDNSLPVPHIRSPHGDSASPAAKNLLNSCYTLWKTQRHRLFHMDGTVETTRVLDSRNDAVSIVSEVLDLVNSGYATMIKSRANP